MSYTYITTPQSFTLKEASKIIFKMYGIGEYDVRSLAVSPFERVIDSNYVDSHIQFETNSGDKYLITCTPEKCSGIRFFKTPAPVAKEEPSWFDEQPLYVQVPVAILASPFIVASLFFGAGCSGSPSPADDAVDSGPDMAAEVILADVPADDDSSDVHTRPDANIQKDLPEPFDVCSDVLNFDGVCDAADLEIIPPEDIHIGDLPPTDTPDTNDAGTDTGKTDTGADVSDTGTTDTGSPDVISDTGYDAGSDTGTDASDAGPTDTGSPDVIADTGHDAGTDTQAPSDTSPDIPVDTATPQDIQPDIPEPPVDPDGDGLTNIQEAALGTNPLKADTDDDGLNDGDEVNVHGTNPLSIDTDNDQLIDSIELQHNADPLDPDTDGDNLLDGIEVFVHFTAPDLADTDEGGLNDFYEVLRGTNAVNNPLDDFTQGIQLYFSTIQSTCGTPSDPTTASLAILVAKPSTSEDWEAVTDANENAITNTLYNPQDPVTLSIGVITGTLQGNGSILPTEPYSTLTFIDGLEMPYPNEWDGVDPDGNDLQIFFEQMSGPDSPYSYTTMIHGATCVTGYSITNP